MADEEYEEIPDEEKLRIATHFILSSPNGEINDVITDVKKILRNPEILDDATLKNILRTYNTTRMLPVSVPGLEHQVPITTFGEVDEEHYFDPKSQRVFQFNHITQEATLDAKEALPTDPDVEKWRAVLEQQLATYVQEQYVQGTCTTAVYGRNENGAAKLILCLSGRNLSLRNFWTGSWRSQYTITLRESEQQATLDGYVKLNVHYFEDGNVQLNTDLPVNVKIRIETPEATSANMISALKKAETDYQNQLEELYVNMSQQTFKAMRRILPLTKSLMNWNANVHRIAKEMKTAPSS